MASKRKSAQQFNPERNNIALGARMGDTMSDERVRIATAEMELTPELVRLGWRRCAVGQRTTQSCGMAEEARAQERERITAAIDALRDGYWKRNAYAAGAFAALSLALRAIDEEDTSHE